MAKQAKKIHRYGEKESQMIEDLYERGFSHEDITKRVNSRFRTRTNLRTKYAISKFISRFIVKH